MGISASNLAAGVGAGALNVQFKADAQVLARNILVMGTGLPASYTANGVVVAVPQLIVSPQQGIALYGAGSSLARLLSAVFAGSNGAVKVWAFPETEGSTAATNASAVTVTASTPGAGTITLYINGTGYSAATTSASTPTTIAAALNTLINADANCTVTSSPTAGVLALTAKSKGLYGNFITLAANSQPGDVMPTGCTVTVAALTSGAGVPTVATDLANGLGTGSQQNILPNGQMVTDVVHAYGQDATTLAALSTYNTQNYDDTVARPFRVLTGDVLATGGAALTALLAIGTTNINDRTNGLIAVPGSLTHPNEIAAIAIGLMAKINNVRGEQNYLGQVLPGVDPGYACKQAGNRWTDQYTNRDTAVTGGISPTIASGGSALLQNVISFYHPATVPPTSNIYREMANISKIQNMLAATILNFSGPKWTGYNIVSDTSQVTVAASRLIARDLNSVMDDWVALVKSFAANGWIYDPEFSLKALKNKASPAITVRAGGDGFLANVPFLMSGVGNIIDSTLQFDTSLAVLAN